MRAVPIYFQTSRWLRAYLEKPGHEAGYKQSAADAYAKLVTDLLANPAANPVRKLGVPENAVNFSYVPPEFRPQSADLLQLPCGLPGPNGDQAGLNNGKTQYDVLRTSFHNLFTRDKEFHGPVAQHPWFSIIDTDSAHHLSGPLVEQAIRWRDPGRLEGAPERRMIVINFDAHTDYGAKNDFQAPVTCQSWGRFVSNTVPGSYDHPLADAYVRFGHNAAYNDVPSWGEAEWHQADAPYVTKKVIEHYTGDEPLIDQLKLVRDQVAGGDEVPIFAYVSLDRDVLKQNYTQYNDGPFNPQAGIDGVKACLSYLHRTGAEIIGFDVTGLPTFPGATRSADNRLPIPDAIALATRQIVELWDHVARL
ncbi:MAG TPA: hypothetical protein VFX16_28505 [Pseudonocardiaceae bacterium]|nr:hypothetical protein [Pseudonocardiaceae bacterium]